MESRLPVFMVSNVNGVFLGTNTTVEGIGFHVFEKNEECILIFKEFEKIRLGVRVSVIKQDFISYGKSVLFVSVISRVHYGEIKAERVDFYDVRTGIDNSDLVLQFKLFIQDSFIRLANLGFYGVSQEGIKKIIFAEPETAADLMFFYMNADQSEIESFFPDYVCDKLMKINELMNRDLVSAIQSLV